MLFELAEGIRNCTSPSPRRARLFHAQRGTQYKGKGTRLIFLVAVGGTRVTNLPSSLSLPYKSNNSMSSPPGFEQRAVDTSICLCALLVKNVKETSEHAFWRAAIDQVFNGLSQAHRAELFQGSHT